ncbi:MAG: YihY/virulence factor BrkB family protein [Muribaculaceae bacterium]|nr:YihY/virulence factor BrkB family protein [Muribaculaceae bacterium]
MPGKTKISGTARLTARFHKLYQYVTGGVWSDPRHTVGVRMLKTANLAVSSFMDRGLQIKSMSLTYRTVLALVPAFALLFAIGRGFGFQNLLEQNLYTYFPSQSKVIGVTLSFVDSYLKEASQGVFVGIGLVVLLWTLISLLSSIEDAFNSIWDIRRDRSLYQKVTDYVAICLMIPILLVCSSGISIFMSTALDNQLHLKFLTPLINVILELLPLILVWLSFSLSFCLIPNTKVEFKYAAIAGGICAIAFQILQLLFVNGQIYVSKYNAIYGSFSFLPLLLVWLQLSWLILLSGCVLTYSLQNVFTYNFLGDISTVSDDYRRRLSILVMAILVERQIAGRPPLTASLLSSEYDIPIRIVNRLVAKLHAAGLVYYVVLEDEKTGVVPAVECETLNVATVLHRLDAVGQSDFIPRFHALYSGALSGLDSALAQGFDNCSHILLKDIALPRDNTKH